MMTAETMNMINTVAGAAVAVLTTAGTWKILDKMGEKGWKALIPVYNTYLLYKNVWNLKMFAAVIVLSAVCLIGGITTIVGIIADTGAAFGLAGMAIVFAAVIARLVIALVLYNKLSKAFGHGIGYTLGIAVFPEIFLPIIGFGKSEFAAAQ